MIILNILQKKFFLIKNTLNKNIIKHTSKDFFKTLSSLYNLKFWACLKLSYDIPMETTFSCKKHGHAREWFSKPIFYF